jgi:hypothetical protein
VAREFGRIGLNDRTAFGRTGDRGCVQNALSIKHTARIANPESVLEAIYRSLAETPAPKNRWLESGGVEVITYPPVPDHEATTHTRSLFNGTLEMARSPNPDIPGGSIALVAINNNRVQEPSNSLG